MSEGSGRNERGLHDESRSCAGRTVNAQVRLCTVVEHQHQGTADTAERVSNEPLVEAGGNALLRGDVLLAISALVDMLNNWLFCLHLETPWLSVPPQTWRRSNHAGVVLPRVEPTMVSKAPSWKPRYGMIPPMDTPKPA